MSGTITISSIDLLNAIYQQLKSQITKEPEIANQGYSYIIWTDGTNYYAKNGKTGQIDFSGTDASTVIQNAINNLTPNRTWKEVVKLKGVFYVSTISLPSYTVLDLREATLIMKNNVNNNMINAIHASNVEIIGGIIDGNKANQTQGHGIYVAYSDSQSFRIYGVEIRNFKGNGIYIYSYVSNGEISNCVIHDNEWSGIDLDDHILETIVTGNTIYNNGLHGIMIDTAGLRNVISGNVVYLNGASGIELYSDAPGYESYGTAIVGNTCWQNRYHGIEVNQYQSGILITGNSCVENNMHGIRVYNSRDIVIAGNMCARNGTSGQPYDGINVYDCYNVTITGNRCFDDRSPRVQRYGISLEGSGGYHIVIGNNPADNTSGTINVGSGLQGCVVRYNRGYVTENGGTVTFSGNNSATQFKIPHGLFSAPTKILVTPGSNDAKGTFYVTADSTYIYVNYATAPPSGTNNVVLYWYAET